MAANPRLHPQKTKRDQTEPRDHLADPAHDPFQRLPKTAIGKPAQKPPKQAN